MASTSQFISRFLPKFLDFSSKLELQHEIKLDDLTQPSDSATIPSEMDAINLPPSRSRRNSATATPKPLKDISQPSPTPTSSKSHYTVFIRLPFPRNNFQDPPPVEWDSIKDRALWKLISTSSNSAELNWEEMSARFHVSLPFLLQQAAWLYERHFDAMRAQLKKLSVASAAATPSGAATPAVGGEMGVGGIPMSRGGSKDSNRPSYINTPRSPLTHGDFDSFPGSPRPSRIVTSRTPSTNTVTQARFLSSPKKPSRPSSGNSADQQTPAGLPRESSQGSEKKSPALRDELYDDSESEDETSVLQSQMLRRTPAGKPPPTRTFSSHGDVEDDEEDSSGGYLPFAASSKSPKEDQEATLRISPRKQNAIPNVVDASKSKMKATQPQQTQDSSASSSTSAQHPPSAPTQASTNNNNNNRSTPLSPRQRAELEKLSPRYKNSGSEDSRSMGSSFSDLDDASVSQSALEDALMSNMQYGSVGMASRMGGGTRDGTGR